MREVVGKPGRIQFTKLEGAPEENRKTLDRGFLYFLSQVLVNASELEQGCASECDGGNEDSGDVFRRQVVDVA